MNRADTERMRVLLVDDEEHIQDLVIMALEHDGFKVAVASTGLEGLTQFEAFSPQLVILDVMLPDVDGFEVCRRLRARSAVPILMLSARSEMQSKVQGLDTGADDYLGKPFRVPELMARVRALLRRLRLGGGETSLLVFEDVVVDVASRKASRAGRPLSLTRREFDLLALLMERPGIVHTREQILTRLWGWDFTGDDNVVDVHISNLRARLGDGSRRLIRTVRGIGYALGD